MICYLVTNFLDGSNVDMTIACNHCIPFRSTDGHWHHHQACIMANNIGPVQPNPDDSPEDPWKWIPTSFNVSTLNMPVIKRTDTMIFLRLPNELWRSCGRCSCPNCKANNRSEGWWDTLAIPVNKPSGNDFSYVVHMPEVV
jgi:hypothetical protein